MMRKMIKPLLLFALLMLTMTLTGCYKEVDPWPASSDFATAVPPTAAPAASPTMAPAAMPDMPVHTQEPSALPVFDQEAEADFWADEATPVPGGSVEPGTNG